MMFINFKDKCVAYDVFVKDLAARIARFLQEDRADPELISQRRAFELFGRRNVERWRDSGRVKTFRRPGKVEYRTADLRLLQRTEQDYFKQSNKE